MTASGGCNHGASRQHSPEPRLLAPADVDQVAGLVFELAAQLHVERQRRMALEEALVRRGLVDPDEVAALAADDAFGGLVDDALTRAQRALLDVLLESDDARGPLRRQNQSER